MNKKNQAIGVFDSGLGGLTVVKEILKLLPNEKIIYFGDTAHLPYGNKSKETVTRFSIENTKFLLKFKVKVIVVACNTSCSLSLKTLKKKYKIPLVGVIEPAVTKALELSRNLRIGVIGTNSTIKSGIYQETLKKKNSKVKVFSKSCPLFVPLVEEDWAKEKITKDIALKYLTLLKKEKIDTLILACTHYPLLKGVIKQVMGPGIKLIDSAKEVARDVKNLLNKERALRPTSKDKSLTIYVSDEPVRFIEAARKIFGQKIKYIRKV